MKRRTLMLLKLLLESNSRSNQPNGQEKTKWIKAWKLSHNKAHIYTAAIRRQGGHHVHSFTLLDLPLHGSPRRTRNERAIVDEIYFSSFFFCFISMVTDNLQFVIPANVKIYIIQIDAPKFSASARTSDDVHAVVGVSPLLIARDIFAPFEHITQITRAKNVQASVRTTH